MPIRMKLDLFGNGPVWKHEKAHRGYTNQEVYANFEMGEGTDGIICPLSDILRDQRWKLLGHIIRRPRDHPQHQATFATRTFMPQQVNKEGWDAQERRAYVKP